MCPTFTGMAAAVSAQTAPSLFATTACEPGHGDVRILDELSAGRREKAGGRRVYMTLVLSAVLAIALALSFVMWVRWRAPAGAHQGGGDGLNVVAMNAPITAGVRQESVSAVQDLAPPPLEARAPTATIIEMPSPQGEKPEMAVRRPEVASARPPETRSAREVTRVAGARAARGATVSRAAARSQGRRGGDSVADSRHSPSQVRRQSVVPKDAEGPIDADVQVIEAIVTRSR